MKRGPYPGSFYDAKVFDYSVRDIDCYPAMSPSATDVRGSYYNLDGIAPGTDVPNVTGGWITPVGLRFSYYFTRNVLYDRTITMVPTKSQTYRVCVFYCEDPPQPILYSDVFKYFENTLPSWGVNSIFDDVSERFFAKQAWRMLYDKILPIMDIRGDREAVMVAPAHWVQVPAISASIAQPSTNWMMFHAANFVNWGTTNTSADVPPVGGVIFPSFPRYGQHDAATGNNSNPLQLDVSTPLYNMTVATHSYIGGDYDLNTVKNCPKMYDEFTIDFSELGLDCPYWDEQRGRLFVMVICDCGVDQPNSAYLKFNFASRFFFNDFNRRIKK